MSFFDRSLDLEQWLARELGRSVRMGPSGKARLMERVRAERPRPVSAPRRAPGPRTRTLYASPVIGIALAASFVGLICVNAVQSLAGRSGADAPAVASAGLGDSVANALHDTLRLVRFMFEAPSARRVTLVGDFNRWDPRATPLATAERRGAWSATVALGPGRHRYAFVVDDTQWLADPGARLDSTVRGRRASVLDVMEGRN